MAITAELFDGTTLEFPDGTDPSVIQATAKRITLERQAGSPPRDDLGEVIPEDRSKGSLGYRAISSIIDPIAETAAGQYLGDQVDLLAGAAKKGYANLQTSIAQSQVAGIMELQEARKAKYGTFENMPPEEKQNYIKAEKYIQEKLGDVAKIGLERQQAEKEHGVRASTKAFNELSKSKEYQEGSFLDKMGMIGGALVQDPVGIITDIGLESLPQSLAVAATAVAARVGQLNPKIAAGLGGSSSAMMEFGTEYAKLREEGMDHAEAWEKAGVKSGIVGLFDAASFYTAGKTAGNIVNNIQKGAVKETAKQVGKEVGTQAALGAAGEGVGSFVTGQEVDPLELTKEAIGEIFGAPGEAIGTYQAKVAEARAAGMPDPEPSPDVKALMESKGFSFKKKPQDEFAEAPQVDITGVGAVPEEVAPAATYESEAQDIDAMLAELEQEKKQREDVLKLVSVDEEKAALEEPKAEVKAEEPAPELPKAVSIKDMDPEDQRTIRSMEVERNKINKEKKLFPAFLRKHGVQPSEKADLGLEGVSAAGIWKKSAPSFDELTSRAIAEGFLLSTGDDIQDVENMREYVRDYLGSGVISTGPDMARQGQLAAIDDAIQEIVRKYEAPDLTGEARNIATKLDQLGQTGPAQAIIKAINDGQPVTPEAIKFLRQKLEEFSTPQMELTGQTAEEARAEAEALEKAKAEEERVASEQQKAEKAKREREEIKQRSEAAAGEFQLGQTAEENLTGQKDIFAAPAAEPLAVESMKRGADFASDGSYVVTLNNGDKYRIYRDTSSLMPSPTWRLSDPVNTEYDLLGWNKQEAIDELLKKVEAGKVKKFTKEKPSVKTTQEEATEKREEYKSREDRLREIEAMPLTQLETPEKGLDSDEFKAAKSNYDEVRAEYRAAIKEYERTGENKADFDKVHKKFDNAIKQLNKAILEDEEGGLDADIPFNIERMMSQPAAYFVEETRTPSLRVEMNRLVKQFNEGKMAPETMMMRVESALDFTKKEAASKPRERGQYILKEKINKAVRRGELMEEAVPLVEWFISQNPALVDDLGISIKTPKEGTSTSGYYNPMSRVITLMKESGNSETAVHEILHHTERMLPEKIQDAIRKSWFSSLTKAAKKAQKGVNKDLDKYYQSLLKYHVEGDVKALKEAKRLLEQGDVDYEHYQHLNPSEFWAVNATDIVAGKFAASKSIVGKLKNWLKEFYQKLKSVFGLQSSAPILRALDSLAKSDGKFVSSEMLAFATDYLNRKNYKGKAAPLASWQDPTESKLDWFLYKIQDKLVDTKRVQEAIEAQSEKIEDAWNVYMKEELYHGRTAKQVNDFLKNELLPIVKVLSKESIAIGDFDEFLHNRHAEERNVQIAKINPNMPDAGSGIATEDARQYLASLDPAKRKVMEKLADKIDAMVKGSQKILIDNGLEEQSTINAWNGAYKHYVPLKREDVDFVHTGTGLGQGFATRGGTSARATGSLKNVVDIFANLALQRERAIIRAEKAKVGKALYGLAIKNPNPDFWLPVNPDAIKNKAALERELVNMGMDPLDAKNLIQEPKQQYIDPRTGLVAWRTNPILRSSDNVFPIRINGQDRFIFFNSSDPRAMRMVSALKNLDAEQLDVVLGTVANVTRWMASVNTQYNPVFGAWNFLRDVQGAILNLSTTKIAGSEKKVLAGVIPALRGIYNDLRSEGKGTGEWAKLWEDFQEAGGQTGYRDQFAKGRRQANVIEREMKIAERGKAKRAFFAVAQWLSDYNDSMENAVRLSAYKVALDKGLSKEQAASLAKNLTVNFNRKGQWSQTVGALYAFFNASVQGTKRLAETMTGPKGRKIMAGGLALGTLQALALAAAGFDDDEPPEFIKSRNLIIPTGGKGYITIPLPLGFNVIPNTGRMMTEFVVSGGKNPGKKVVNYMSMVFDAFNPIGGSGLQLVAPTVLDPLAAIETNKDAFGRPIAKQDRATAPTPGYTRSRENATEFSKYLAEFLNYASGGTKYKKGAVSPTADQIDYLVGQFTGGVGREVMKGVSAVRSIGSPEELPPYKIPVVGKIYGNTESPANIASKFYENVTMLSQHENEIKGRIKNRENATAYIRENPVARLYNMANSTENEISKLNKQKKEMIERKMSKESIKRIEDRKTLIMQRFNERVKKLED